MTAPTEIGCELIRRATENADLAHQLKSAQIALELSESLRLKLLREVGALRAQESPLFAPKSMWESTRQLECEAYALGMKWGGGNE